MFNKRSIPNGNPFERELEDEIPSSCPSASRQRPKQFIKIPIVIVFSIIVFILIIAGTATTTISFPPKPKELLNSENQSEIKTALDGDYKLIGPLLLTSGIFMLIIDVILIAIIAKDAYISFRAIHPSNVDGFPKPESVNVLGGPFYLATPNPTVNNPNGMVPFAYSRQLWTMPNAPTPDFLLEEENMKISKARATTATLVRNSQPPFNPDVKAKGDDSLN